MSGKKLQSMLALTDGSFAGTIEAFFRIQDGKLEFENEFKHKNKKNYFVSNALASGGMIVEEDSLNNLINKPPN